MVVFMFDLSPDHIEDKLKKIEKKITEIEIRNQKLNQDTEELFAEFQVAPEQLTEYLQSKENFSEKNWEEIQHHTNQIEKKLSVDLNCIHNPMQTKKTFNEKNIDPSWLFVN